MGRISNLTLSNPRTKPKARALRTGPSSLRRFSYGSASVTSDGWLAMSASASPGTHRLKHPGHPVVHQACRHRSLGDHRDRWGHGYRPALPDDHHSTTSDFPERPTTNGSYPRGPDDPNGGHGPRRGRSLPSEEPDGRIHHEVPTQSEVRLRGTHRVRAPRSGRSPDAGRSFHAGREPRSGRSPEAARSFQAGRAPRSGRSPLGRSPRGASQRGRSPPGRPSRDGPRSFPNRSPPERSNDGRSEPDRSKLGTTRCRAVLPRTGRTIRTSPFATRRPRTTFAAGSLSCAIAVERAFAVRLGRATEPVIGAPSSSTPLKPTGTCRTF